MKKYTIIDYPVEGKTFGTYSANSPGQAASKAFSILAKKMGYDGDDREKFVIFSIKEKCDGKISNDKKNCKVYEYVGTRVKLHKPIHLGSRTYNYRNIVVNHKNKYFD